MQPQSLRVEAADGCRLHLLEWSREGVPLLLIHGFGNEAHVWDEFAPEVAPYYRTLALDLRGHGDSQWHPQGRYELDDFVADLERVTAALALSRLVLVAHSLGGRVATLFAGRHPERLAGLVLVDIGPEVDARGALRIRQDVEANPDPSFASVEDCARELCLAHPAARPEALLRMARHGLRRRDDGRHVLKMDPALRRFGRLGETPDEAARREEALGRALWDALRRVSCPTLVVRGAASDLLSAEVAERMVDEALPHGRLAVVARAGHPVMTDNPEGFRDAVAGFVLTGA